MEFNFKSKDKELSAAYTTIFEALKEMKQSGIDADKVLLAIDFLTKRARYEGVKDTKRRINATKERLEQKGGKGKHKGVIKQRVSK